MRQTFNQNDDPLAYLRRRLVEKKEVRSIAWMCLVEERKDPPSDEPYGEFYTT
jgi:hypothetical protein